jgi:hypothetical protein
MFSPINSFFPEFHSAGHDLYLALKEIPVNDPEMPDWQAEEPTAERLENNQGKEGKTGSARTNTDKPKGTKKPLEKSDKESDKLKLQVYNWIQSQHATGKKPAAILDALKADQDRREQVKQAGLKLNKALVKAALALHGQRERDQQRKNQESPPT